MCVYIFVLESLLLLLLQDSRCLFIYPMKALAQDQRRATEELAHRVVYLLHPCNHSDVMSVVPVRPKLTGIFICSPNISRFAISD